MVLTYIFKKKELKHSFPSINMCGHILNRFTAKQTRLIEYQSLFSFSTDYPLGIPAEFAVLFVHFLFLGRHFIIHHTARQNIKSFHPLLDKGFHFFPFEWCNFINICWTVGHRLLIQAMIYDIAVILLRSELCSLSGSCFLSSSAGKQRKTSR